MVRAILVVFALTIATCAGSAATEFDSALQLGTATPAKACSNVADCSFVRRGVEYISFEGLITKREVCAPLELPYGIRLGQSVKLVSARIKKRFGVRTVVSPAADGTLKAVSGTYKRGADDITISVSFDAQDRAKCVSEMITAI